MARINQVKKARQEWICSVCKEPIKAGDPYKYTCPRARPRVNAHPGCNIPARLTSSSKMVVIWEAQEDVSKAESTEDIVEALRDLTNTAREVADEYEEGADNQEEHFPGSSIAEESRDKASNLQSWADEIEATADEIEQLEISDFYDEAKEVTGEDNDEELEEEAKRLMDEKAKELAAIADECPE